MDIVQPNSVRLGKDLTKKNLKTSRFKKVLFASLHSMPDELFNFGLPISYAKLIIDFKLKIIIKTARYYRVNR